MRNIILIFFIFFCILYIYPQKKESKTDIDSIIELRKLSANTSFPIEERFLYAKRASELSYDTKIDSTILISNKNLSFYHLMMNNLSSYRKLSINNLKLAKKINDSTSIANANHNLGYYHHANQQHDSAYYYYSEAIEIYDQLKQERNLSSVLINVANIQQVENDFIGSEENAIKAIEVLQKLPKTEDVLDDLWILYNLLGINALNLKLYQKSLEYHDEALKISSKMEFGEYNRLYSINNEAFVYRKLGDLDKAIDFYSRILEKDNLYDEDPSFYALILENIAYTRFINGDKELNSIETLFQRAYKISDSIEDPITKVGVTISMAKFYKALQKKDNALKYANETYKVSKEIESNDILLESLIILSELNKGEVGKAYLNEHIRLSDSLLDVERNVRERFARIEFDTDKLELENERISQQKMWLLIVSAVLLVTLFLLYIIITQRAKNKELQFEKDQQKANEEIYNLMLSQQDKVDEARANEKKRISQEMHDGILGRLFGTRLSLDSLNFSEGKEAIQNRSNYINELKTIEDDIRKISHDLNTDFVSGSGFMDIVSELIEKQTGAYQLKYKFDYTDDINWEYVSNKNKINIYRIIQESLQNIYKHAKAETIKISFELKNNVICLSVNDDGEGFDVNKSKKGIGIKNINARVNDLEGSVDFISQLNKGTTISIYMPYKIS
ncbi:tetratricopeptide repeat-containing sensor histidine kinase [uncultured Psychroserpens sp.]|uniref:ATP-binding protein n=1 Tax=uncultured Psychroserpens sp. TaxID=255436 RepID=UPI0026117DCC|nr:tetratricopeptide repeat-containing sensor histidine kinase [uncultured Psychroserpens sp.]